MKNCGTEKGLPEKFATTIAQSPDGCVWFGTFDPLVRFEGDEFTVLNRQSAPRIPSSGIDNLHLDKRRRFWFSTHGGLVVREGQHCPVMTKKEKGDYIRGFVRRRDGELLPTCRAVEFCSAHLSEPQGT
jgi:ligand-binding sensor domain-containing protein